MERKQGDLGGASILLCLDSLQGDSFQINTHKE